MTARAIAGALCLAGASFWLFRLTSGEPLFADLGFVVFGVGVTVAVVATVSSDDCEYGFLDGVVGAYGGAVASVTYRFLLRPRSSLDTHRVADGIGVESGVVGGGVAAPEAAIAVAGATTFAIGLAGDRREHAGALFLAAPPAVAALVSLAGSDAVGVSTVLSVAAIVAVAAGTLFYAGRYLRGGSESSAVAVGFA